MKAAPFSHLLMAGVLSGSVLCAPAYADAEAPRGSMFGGAAPIGAKMLADQRGGAEVRVLNASMTDGAVHDNVASNVRTGSNLITEGALAGAAGIPVVVQNSGNNVLIQNSTIVNMQVQ